MKRRVKDALKLSEHMMALMAQMNDCTVGGEYGRGLYK